MKTNEIEILSKRPSNYEENELRQRIEARLLDEADAEFPSSKKLAKEENWTLAFMQEAMEEYKKFVLLCCISPTGTSPSQTVDKVWHMHLIYTKNYWEDFCADTLKRKLHHHPSKGGKDEHMKHTDWYGNTMKIYKQVFGTAPPEHIWPTGKKDNGKSLLPNFKSKWKNIKQGIMVLVIALLAEGCTNSNGGFDGGITLFLLLAVIIFFFIVYVVANSDSNNGGKSNVDSSGGGGGSGGDGAGGGCGGGGCGGCGGG